MEFGSCEFIAYSVNSVSKFETSVSDLITGIKGGLYYFLNKISQFTFKNHG